MENTQEDEAKEAEIVKSIYSALVSLPKTESRAEILSELHEYREHSVFPTLFFATFGCMASLVHEIILFYSEATFEKLSTTSSQRMQHVTGIVQSLAREKEICVELVHNNFISLLYPILNIIRVDSNLDIIQMAILGIIYDVVISDEEKLLETALSGNIFEVISRMIVNHHNELAKTVALYTLLKIMEKEIGLRKMFESHDQTRCIFGALRTMILEVVNNSDQPNYKICKHTVKIYKILFDYRKNVEYPVLKEIPIEINSEHIKDILSKDNQGLAIWQKLVEEVRHQRKENSKHIYHASLQALKDSSNQK